MSGRQLDSKIVQQIRADLVEGIDQLKREMVFQEGRPFKKVSADEIHYAALRAVEKSLEEYSDDDSILELLGANRYIAMVIIELGLLEPEDFYADNDSAEPGITMPDKGPTVEVTN